MFDNVLVPVDGSEDSWAALQQAVWVTGPNALLHGLYVVDVRLLEGPIAPALAYGIGMPYADPSSMHLTLELTKRMSKRGEQVLKEFSRRCREAGRRCETEIVEGVISSTICNAGKGRDLIVMGMHGEGAPWATVLLGSTFEAVIRSAEVPVLGVPSEPRFVRRIMVAYDGSEKSADALLVGSALAKDLGASLVVMTVAGEEEAREKLADAREKLPEGVEARFVGAEGHAAATIVETAEKERIDLISIGAYSYGKFLSFLFGSTVDQVVRKAPCPVLVCR